MQRILVKTSDGWHTLTIPYLDLTYRSIHVTIKYSIHIKLKLD
jgi:hypothetical protein